MKYLGRLIVALGFAAATFPALALEAEDCVSLMNEKLVVGDGTYTPPDGVYMTGTGHTTKPNGALSLIVNERSSYPLLESNAGTLQSANLNFDRSRSVLSGKYKHVQMDGGLWSGVSSLYVSLRSARIWQYSHVWNDGWKQWSNVSCYRAEGNKPQQMIIRGEYDYGRGIDFNTITLEAWKLI